ncbi:hypothetical protein Hanom_Chr05g00475501 [Helianthus anomalus]
MRSDVRQSASIFKRSVRQIRHWLEEESKSASKYVYNTYIIRIFECLLLDL